MSCFRLITLCPLTGVAHNISLFLKHPCQGPPLSKAEVKSYAQAGASGSLSCNGCPQDNRLEINGTTSYPYSAIGQLLGQLGSSNECALLQAVLAWMIPDLHLLLVSRSRPKASRSLLICWEA